MLLSKRTKMPQKSNTIRQLIKSKQLLKINTSFSDEIENKKRGFAKYPLKKAAAQCNMCRFGVRNGTYCIAKRPVSQAETAGLAGRFWSKNTVSCRFLANIMASVVAHLCHFLHNIPDAQPLAIARPFSHYLPPRCGLSARTRFSESFFP